jgi:hypothetical protein
MRALGERHVVAETGDDVDALMATLVQDPVYEFHPCGLTMRGQDAVQRFYQQFFEHFVSLRDSYELLSEWVSEESVAQEYDIGLRVDGKVEHFRVIGVLYAEGELLGGERVYGSERFVQLLTGVLFDELSPIEPGGARP